MISILVSAYQAEDYLEDLIKSIDFEQAELLIVIDNCFKTRVEGKRLEKKYPQVRWFNSYVNNGPYININSLVDYAKYNFILPFGADDHFKEGALSVLNYELRDYLFDVVRFRYTNYKGNKYIKEMECVADGAFVIKKSLFNYLGGFMPWRCAADTELKLRALENKALEFRIEFSLFMRRLHDNALTQSKSTGVGSKHRTEAIEYIKANKGKRKPIIMETVKLIEL